MSLRTMTLSLWMSLVLAICLQSHLSDAFVAPLAPRCSVNSVSASTKDNKGLLSSLEDREEPINGDTASSSYTFIPRAVNEPTGYSTDSGYSQFLTKAQERNRKRLEREQEQDEDGYDAHNKQSSLLKQIVKFPLKVAGKALVQKRTEPGTLILVRHGESTWNRNRTFTGWADADLSEQGVREVEHAARLLLEGGYEIDIVFTSRLKRAIKSVWIFLQEMNQSFIPVYKSWRLNERMYGALTGLSKKDTATLLGQELVQSW